MRGISFPFMGFREVSTVREYPHPGELIEKTACLSETLSNILHRGILPANMVITQVAAYCGRVEMRQQYSAGPPQPEYYYPHACLAAILHYSGAYLPLSKPIHFVILAPAGPRLGARILDKVFESMQYGHDAREPVLAFLSQSSERNGNIRPVLDEYYRLH